MTRTFFCGLVKVRRDYETVLDDVVENAMEILPINFKHTVIQNKLPFHHKNPFDRIIVSQAIIENMDLIIMDSLLDLYLVDESVKRIW